jgi:hypothetical protein
MLVMVVERFEPGALSAIRERFTSRGRMLPDAVQYIDSWMSADGSHCYQLMQTPDERALQPWIDAWADLARFEVVPVMRSADFWADRRGPTPQVSQT